MQANWRIGTLFGIPLFVNSSWFAILALLTLANADLARSAGVESPLASWAIGFAVALLLFASVLLHELGHSLVAKAQGIPVNSIALFLFGGVAAIDRESETPGKAFQVAIAGPAVSLVLSAVCFVLAAAVGSGWSQVLLLNLARINLVLGLFNLAPGLPLDGGQVLKAGLWKLTGDRWVAARWAARSGQGLGLMALTLGLFGFIFGESFGPLWIALIGWFIWSSANRYERLSDLQAALLQVSAADAMTRELRVLDATQTLRRFADEYVLGTLLDKPLYAASDGRYRGAVLLSDLRATPRGDWDYLTLADIARPLATLPSVRESATLAEVILALDASGDPYLTVLSPADTLAGVIDRGDVVRALASRGVWSATPEAIAAIKAQRDYPAQLGLVEVARAAIATPAARDRTAAIASEVESPLRG